MGLRMMVRGSIDAAGKRTFEASHACLTNSSTLRGMPDRLTKPWPNWLGRHRQNLAL